MKTTVLEDMYRALTPWERLPLIVDAAIQKDDVQREKLCELAPTITLTFSDHMGAGRAICEAAHFHALMVLELTAQFWQWWGMWGCEVARKVNSPKNDRRKTKADREEVRLFCMVRYHAYLFVTHVDAWNQFCAKLPIDHEVLLTRLPGWGIRKRTESLAREEAFSQKDAVLFLLTERGDLESDADDEVELPRIPTVDGLVEEWQTIVREAEKLFMGKS